ncbi:DNA repair protein REV1 [Brachionichthys hirsutus]|uniref:DNA repair protein REV1 n=1 Tax=Brachionichthys hirsutus TaxID=412623 RepID=UPI003604F10C
MSRDGWMKKKAKAAGDNGWAERGGYMAAKVSKLDEQFRLEAPREKQKEGLCSSVFRGVSIYVNGYTDPSADELRRLMMLHGGQFHSYYSRTKTSHIITNNLPNSKIQALKGEKVVRPEWITDSIKAGRLLPSLQYQLYAKQKGPLYPGVALRQTSEIAGPSHGLLHQKLHPPQLGIQSSSSCHHGGVPQPLYQSNLQPRFMQQSSLQPGRLACSNLNAESRSRNLSNPSPTEHPHNPPRSPPHTPRPGPPRRNAYQPQPQINASCCKEGEVHINGFFQTSLDTMSHSKMNEMPECGRDDPVSQVAREPPLTNGHAHTLNGALMDEDVSPRTEGPSVDGEMKEFILKSPDDQPPAQFQAKPDPYEFPHSPPKRSDRSSVLPEQRSSQRASEHSSAPPHPTRQEASKAPTGHLPSEPLHSPRPADSKAEKKSPLSHSPARLNGSHHGVFSSDAASLSTTNTTTASGPASDQSAAAAGVSAPLLAQTGGLIADFYSHSRLHQISTWRTGFSEYVNELHGKRKAAAAASFPGKDKLKKSVARLSADCRGMAAPASVNSCVLHVDMDCFFVSVGIRHRPELRGKPVAVTSNRGEGRVPRRVGTNPRLEQQYYQRKRAPPHPEGGGAELDGTPSQESPDVRGNGEDRDAAALSMAEIASCSYEARQAGVRNGMFFGRAKQLCPSLQSVPYDFEAYKEVALAMYETLAGYTHDIEALSCDEVLMDGSSLLAELGVGPEDLAKAIRADINDKTGCCASVGMGSNILLARLATRKAKPDGQYLLRSEEVDDFIRDLPVTSLPGVGPVMGRKLAAVGVRACGDLQQVSLPQLQKKFGPRTGQTLFRFCRGLDDRPVRYEKERKSVSAEMNYNIRFVEVEEAECFLTNLSMEVQKRLQQAGLRGRRVTLKVMVRKVGAPLEPAKYGGHGICDNLARTVMLPESTDSGQLIAAAVIKLFHAMKLQVQDMRGVGIQVQLLDGGAHQDSTAPRTRSIKEMLLDKGISAKKRDAADSRKPQKSASVTVAPSSDSTPRPPSTPEPVPGTSRDQQTCRQTSTDSRTRINVSIEVPSPSQVDRSVLEALPVELREQVEQAWLKQDVRQSNHRSQSPHPSSPLRPPPPPTAPGLYAPPAGTLVLQIPNQPDSPGIVLELPNFSQVDPDVFAVLPKELQEELKSAYNHVTNVQPRAKLPKTSAAEQKNPLLQLKQSGVGVARVKRRCKRKNALSPVKKGPSPVKRHRTTNSPAKILPAPKKSPEPMNAVKTENGPSTSASKPEITGSLSKFIPRRTPTLAGACDLTDVKTLLKEWVTTITEPMEEDILQVVRYCTDLIDDKDLERLDLIIKYMKRLMQQSAESVWSMAFDFILDNVQLVVQQAYGSTLKVA